jgi:DNA-binding NtrC family response regulator
MNMKDPDCSIAPGALYGFADVAEGTMHEITDPPSPARQIRVLVVDDDRAFLTVFTRVLARAGLDVVAVSEPFEGLTAASEPDIDVVVSDIQMPNLSGADLLRQIKTKRPAMEIVLMTGSGTVEAAVAAVKAGAYDYLTKPIEDSERVVFTIRKAAELTRFRLRTSMLEGMLQAKEQFDDVVGQSRKMTELFQLIEAVAPSPATVLLQGESGTGKELVARAIHRRSPRKLGPFVVVNCSALTETLLESELFGHVKGAFTGATRDREGLFRAADNGTLFLDEIGDMPLPTQVRMLRALQEGEIRPVGSEGVLRVDVRVIAASNVDLAKAREQGRFREDLFYRLNVIAIQIPPLRDRPEDIPPLVHHFIRKCGQKVGKSLSGVSSAAMEALTTYAWPGNVRELENAIERAVVLARGPELESGDLPPGLGAIGPISDNDVASLSHLPLVQAKRLAVRAFERRYLANVLRRERGNVTRAAEVAGVDRSNFRRLLKEYGVAARSEPDEPEAG